MQVIEARCCESNVYQRLSLTVLRNLVFPNGELPLNYQLVRVSGASFSHGYIEILPSASDNEANERGRYHLDNVFLLFITLLSFFNA